VSLTGRADFWPTGLDADGEPVDLHLVMDNYAAHKHPNVKIWLALAAECYPDEHRNLNSTTSKKLSCWAIHGIRPRDIFACVDDGR
jgi:hypothetical protein